MCLPRCQTLFFLSALAFALPLLGLCGHVSLCPLFPLSTFTLALYFLSCRLPLFAFLLFLSPLLCISLPTLVFCLLFFLIAPSYHSSFSILCPLSFLLPDISPFSPSSLVRLFFSLSPFKRLPILFARRFLSPCLYSISTLSPSNLSLSP